MRFTEAQILALRSVGASLDAKDMAMVNKLASRGLGPDDFVAAYRGYFTLRTNHPELASLDRDAIETIAVALKMGLGEEDTYWLVLARHSRNRTLTQTSDKQAPSGPGMMTFGAVATGAGVVLLAVGLALASDETYDHEKYENVPSTWGYAGKAMAISGGVGIVLGLSTTILGLYRWTTPSVDDGARARNEDQPIPTADSRQPRSKTRWALSPSLGAHGVGFGLTAGF